MQDNMSKGLVIDALEMAIKSRKPGPDLIAHELPRISVLQPFVYSFKTKHIYFNNFKTRAEATQSIFEFIEVFYNRNRLHSTLGICSPLEYEAEIRNVA